MAKISSLRRKTARFILYGCSYVMGKENAIGAETVVDNSLIEELAVEGLYAKLYGGTGT